MCYRQMLTETSLNWHRTRFEPVSVVGDPRWWGDYRVSTDAMLEQAGSVYLIGRVENYDGASVSGYHLKVSATGAWTVFTEDQQGNDATLAEGTTKPIGVDSWHDLALSFHGSRISAFVDGSEVAEITDTSHTTGQVGIGTSVELLVGLLD